MRMSSTDKIIGVAAIIVITLCIWWCYNLLSKAPFAQELRTGIQAEQAGIPNVDKVLLKSGSN